MKRPGRYCLRCYAPLSYEPRASESCSDCGFVNLAVDRKIYWNREPRLIAVERAAKAVIVLVTVLVLAVLLAAGHFSLHAGYAVAGALIPAGVLWATASKLTHHVPLFRAGLFWSGTFVGLALLPVFALGLVTFLSVATSAGSPFVSSRGADSDLASLLLFVFIVLAWAGLCWLLSRGVRRMVARCEAWRDARIVEGMEHAAHAKRSNSPPPMSPV